jgi:hypothetical protein
VPSSTDITAQPRTSQVDLPSVHSDNSTDPLQARRAELIDHYDRHGYPERARYLERANQGPVLLRRAAELAAPQKPAAAGRELLFDLVGWWTGWPPEPGERLFVLFCALSEFTARARAIEKDPRAQPDARRRSRERVRIAQEACRPLLDAAVAVGLWARVNTYLAPMGIPTADSFCHDWLKVLRGICGSYAPICIAWPWPNPPDTSRPYLIVCERCSVVDLATRPSNRCRQCAHSRPVPKRGVLVPVTRSELPWLVTSTQTAYVRQCEQCGETFAAHRASARTCSTACRVARSRHAKTEREGPGGGQSRMVSPIKSRSC